MRVAYRMCLGVLSVFTIGTVLFILYVSIQSVFGLDRGDTFAAILFGLPVLALLCSATYGIGATIETYLRDRH